MVSVTATGPKRQANADLSLTRRGPRERHVRDVGAGDDQQEADADHHRCDRRLKSQIARAAKEPRRFYGHCHGAIAVRCRRRRLELVREDCQLRLDLPRRHARAHTAHDLHRHPRIRALLAMGYSAACMLSGAQKSGTCGGLPMPMKSSDVTLTIVQTTSFTVSDVPTTLASPLNRRSQKSWLSTTTGCWPEVEPSPVRNGRPATTRAPRLEKKLSDTSCPCNAVSADATRSGQAAAPSSATVRLRSRKFAYSRSP